MPAPAPVPPAAPPVPPLSALAGPGPGLPGTGPLGHRAAEALGGLTGLDVVIRPLATAVEATAQATRTKPVLRGDWLGHRLHPLATDGVIGAWMAAAVLDATGADETAARRLVGFGLLSAVPVVLTGLSDMSDCTDRDRRIALVHAGCNGVAAALYGASYVQRVKGNRRAGKLLGFAGLSVAGASGFLGGHMTMARGTGADTRAALVG